MTAAYRGDGGCVVGSTSFNAVLLFSAAIPGTYLYGAIFWFTPRFTPEGDFLDQKRKKARPFLI
jgi:hypothetical protein